MTKRSAKFKRNKRDFYATPPEAVVPLLPHLGGVTFFVEPCFGKGHLVCAIHRLGGPICVWESDMEHDAATTVYQNIINTPQLAIPDAFITNPPWTREILHPIIENLSRQLPTWLLLDADWMHTKQAIPYMGYCRKIVSIGRVSWMQNGVSGFDNCCWYLFDREPATTEFIARAA